MKRALLGLLLVVGCGGGVLEPEHTGASSCLPLSLCLLPDDAGTGECDPSGSACVDRNYWPIHDAGEECFPALTDCASDGGCKQGRVCIPAGAVHP